MTAGGAAPASARGGDALPTRRLKLIFAGIEVEIEVVARLEDHVDPGALLRDEEVPEPPYWLHLWTGSRALARAVAERSAWQGSRVADLGCGLGLAGLVAARLGARVLLVDAVFEALRLARRSAAANGCRVEAVQTDLRRAGLRGRFDALLLADVTYDPSLQEALAEAVARHLAPGGLGLCAESVRNQDLGFRRACESRGLGVTEREVREIEDGRPVPVRLTEVRWR